MKRYFRQKEQTIKNALILWAFVIRIIKVSSFILWATRFKLALKGLLGKDG